MTQIEFQEAVADDMLVSYYSDSKRGVRVLTYMKVVDDKFVKILAGKSRRANPKLIRYDHNDVVLRVYMVKPQDYIERNADYSDVEFFRLTDEETHLLIAEFV